MASYQPYNRMTATAAATMSFAAIGNMVQKTEGSNYWRYARDYENRMTMAATRKQTARYRDDALSGTVYRYLVGNKENTKFTYDGLYVVIDAAAAHAGITKYSERPRGRRQAEPQERRCDKVFLQDHLGSTAAVTKS